MNKPSFSYPVLQHPAPEASKEQAETLFSKWMEDGMFLKTLSSERDQNFLFKNKHERRFVLKVANTKEAFEVLDCQNKAMEHLALNTSLNIPKVIPSLDDQKVNQFEINNIKHYVRVLSYVEGVPVGDAKRPQSYKALYRNMGSFLGALGKGLSNFSHPGSKHKLLWDVRETDSLFELLICIKDQDKRALAKDALDYFVENIKDKLEEVRTQVIHNDMNPDNLLVRQNNSDQVSGIIDFGDTVYTSLVNDLAVAAAYQTVKQENLLLGTRELLLGYQETYPLTEDEIMLLPGLIVNRIAMSLIISEWRASEHPKNQEYILGSIDKTWEVLKTVITDDFSHTAGELNDL